MKRIFAILCAVVAAASCGKDRVDTGPSVPRDGDGGSEHDMIVLGRQLDDPYSVKNVEKAVKSLYPEMAGRVDVTPTDTYVRFLPKDGEEFDRLRSMGIDMTDHPLDYQILREGDYYHDPSLPEEDITWQYAVVPYGFELPEGIRTEILDQCYISRPEATRASSGIDWEAVEREAYRLTGNGDMLLPRTKAEGVEPSGRITITDPLFNGGAPFGVSGVMVCCNSFVRFSYCHTDRDGYYQMKERFASEPRYRLVFKNDKDFSIGFNLILVPASVSSFGKGSPEGINVNVTNESDNRLFRRCVVNNAVYEYISRCSEEDMGIKAPPRDLRIWIFKNLSASSSVMLHHGAIVDRVPLENYLGAYKTLLKAFLPDITIGTGGSDSYAEIYGAVVHELAHASHYAQVGNDYWDCFIRYIVTSFLSTGGKSYGDGTGTYAGHCEVGEMWAYFMQSKMFMERYGGPSPTFGTSWWFYPQILRYLDERGMTRSQIYRSLSSDVTSRKKLQDKMIDLFPEHKQMIDQVFGRYGGM